MKLKLKELPVIVSSIDLSKEYLAQYDGKLYSGKFYKQDNRYTFRLGLYSVDFNPDEKRFRFEGLWEILNKNPSSRKPKPKLRSNKIVWIINPKGHGNGGWCGSKVVKKCTLKEALATTKDELDYYFDDNCHSDTRTRICVSEDINEAIYIYDVDENDNKEGWIEADWHG